MWLMSIKEFLNPIYEFITIRSHCFGHFYVSIVFSILPAYPLLLFIFIQKGLPSLCRKLSWKNVFPAILCWNGLHETLFLSIKYWTVNNGIQFFYFHWKPVMYYAIYYIIKTVCDHPAILKVLINIDSWKSGCRWQKKCNDYT